MARPWPQDQERKAVGWLGRGVVELGLFCRPQHGLLFSASLARQRILRCLGWTTVRVKATSSDVADGGVAALSKGAMYQAMHCCREKQGIQQTAIRRRRIRCFLHSPSDANCIFGRPDGLTGLTGPQPYVSPSLRAFQIAVLLQIAQSQFVSVESHSSVFFRLLYVVNMVSKTCFLINVDK